MTSINASINLTDRMSGTFANISNTMAGVINQMSNLNTLTSTGPSTAGLDEASQSVKEIESTMKGAEGAINKATQAQAQFTKEVKETEKAGDKLASVMKGIVGIAVLTATTKKLIETSDQMTLITGRLDNINDGAQTTAELIDMIQKSAGRGRAEFFATADAVAKLVNNTGDLFTTTREAVEFTELLNKTFSASGSSAQEISSVMLQLNQAMAMNTLRAQEFNAIISGAPKIIEYIAKSMGVAKNEVKALASQGLITAEVIKNAMFEATEDINANFENIPMTFENVKTQLGNQFVEIFGPLWKEIEKFVNSDALQQAIVPIAQALGVVMGVLLTVLNVFTSVFNVTMKYWTVAGPVLIALTTIIGLYSGAILLSTLRTKLASTATAIHSAVTSVNAKIMGLSNVTINAHTIATALSTVATWAMATATTALGVALTFALSPIGLIVIAIGAIIGIIKLVVVAYNKLTGKTLSMTDAIKGAIQVLVAGIYNIVAGVVNFFIGVVEVLVNLFRNPTDKIKNMFVSLAVGIIDVMIKIVEPVATIVKTIVGFFVDGINGILGGVSTLYNAFGSVLGALGIDVAPIDLKVNFDPDTSAVDALKTTRDNIAGKHVDIVDSYNLDSKKLDYKNIHDAWDKGANVNDMADEDPDVGDIKDNTDIIADGITSMDKSISYLIDVARRDADVTNTNNMTINVEYTGTQASEGMRGDVEQMARMIGDELNRAINTSARGVY